MVGYIHSSAAHSDQFVDGIGKDNMHCQDIYLTRHLVQSLAENAHCCEKARQLSLIIETHEKYFSTHREEFFNQVDRPNFFERVTSELFKDGFNFGRLTCVLCLVKYCARKFLEGNQPDKAQSLLEKTFTLCMHWAKDITALGGWSEFFKFFDPHKTRKHRFKILLVAIGLVSSIFALYQVIRKH